MQHPKGIVALAEHPAIVEAAVVSMPDAQWGEVPRAFVTTTHHGEVGTDELNAKTAAEVHVAI